MLSRLLRLLCVAGGWGEAAEEAEEGASGGGGGVAGDPHVHLPETDGLQGASSRTDALTRVAQGER